MKPLVFKKRKRIRHAPPVRQAIHVSRGDTVQIISGDDKGKRGKVMQVFPKTGRVKVAGINIITKHTRPNQQGAEGGIIKLEGTIHHSKVMLIDPKSGEPSRIRRRRSTAGTTERVAIKSGQPIVRVR